MQTHREVLFWSPQVAPRGHHKSICEDLFRQQAVCEDNKIMCEPLSGEWVRRGWGDGQEDNVRGGHVERGVGVVMRWWWPMLKYEIMGIYKVLLRAPA